MTLTSPVRFSFVRLLPRLALGGFAVSLLAGILVPLYTDEVLWRLHLRAAIDGGFDITYNDLCGPNTIARAPWLMMPVRWFSVLSDFNGSIQNPAQYLVSRDSDGIVIGCKYLPLELSQAQSGQICAISRKMLEEVAAAQGPGPFSL